MREELLPKSFYLEPTLMVARALLGKTLVRRFAEGEVATLRIVETEAYTVDDPACHAFRGETKRNGAMFGAAGTAYVHINYGLYYCLNVVTQPEGVPEGVLIRGAEPLMGAVRLYRNYFGLDRDEETAFQERRLGAGPGRLGMALALDRTYDRTDLTSADSPLSLRGGESVAEDDVVTTTRIGITKGADYPWRFYVRSSRFVSKR